MFLFTLFISKTCLEIFQKHSWQEIFHSERVTPSLTAQKIIFSSEWWQSQGSERVNVQWALTVTASAVEHLVQSGRVERAGWFGNSSEVWEGAEFRSSSRGRDRCLPLLGQFLEGRLCQRCHRASQGTGLWHCRQTHSFLLSPPLGSLCGRTVLRHSRNLGACGANHLTGGEFSLS